MSESPDAHGARNTFYEFTCRHIEREESLVDHRISWMLTSQGFLITGFAFATGGSAKLASVTGLTYVIEAVGLAVALLSLAGIWAAYRSIDNLMAKWTLRSADCGTAYPDITTRRASRFGRVLGYGLPFVLMAAWLYLIIQTL